MRIPSGTIDQYIYFYGVDASDFTTPETGLTATSPTFRVYRSRNGAAAAAMTTPTINEVDATNMPGVYELLLDEDTTIAAGNDSEEMVLHISHDSMAPVVRTIELYRPKITEGETIAVSSGAVDNVTLVATTTTNTDMRGTDGANTTAPDNASIAAILTDTGTTLPATLSTIEGKVDTVDGVADAILLDTGTTLPTTLATIAGYLDTEIAAILEDTGTRLPAQISALNNFDPATDVVARVTLVDTTTANTDMRGTDSAYTGTPPTANENADALLTRDWTAVTGEAARSTLNALRFLRNKWSLSGSTLTVTEEDDSTTAWTGTVTSDSGADPVTGNDPS